jgi:hypothetical protein
MNHFVEMTTWATDSEGKKIKIGELYIAIEEISHFGYPPGYDSPVIILRNKSIIEVYDSNVIPLIVKLLKSLSATFIPLDRSETNHG